MLLVGLINTLQPVKLEPVVEMLSPDFDPLRLKTALKSLRREGMLIDIGDGKYLVSRGGRDAMGVGRYAIQRDISRMVHLFKESKGGREGE